MRSGMILAASYALLATSAFAAKTTVTTTETLTPSTKHTATTLKAKMPSFSTTKTYRTASGASITGQQYLDILNKFQGAADRAGCTLGTGGTCQFVASDAKFTAAELAGAAKRAESTVPKTPQSTTPAASPLGFSWSNEWGNHSTGAVYVGADFGNGGGSASASCTGSAYAGVWLFGNQKEIARLTGTVSSSSSSTTKSVGLYMFGDATPVSTRTSTGSIPSYEKSFTVKKSFSYWGLITISLSATATAKASVSTTLSATSSSSSYTCGLTVTPTASAKVKGTAEVSILGFGNLSAAAVGVDANVTLASLSLPVVASVSATKGSGSSVTFTESLSGNIDLTYLSGSLAAYFKTSFPLDGEHWTDWDSDKFSFTLLEWDGGRYTTPMFATKNATQTL